MIVDIARDELTDDNLKIIISEMEKVYVTQHDSNNIKRLKKQLRECESATSNLLKALEQGQAADIITTQLVKRQSEATEIKKQIAKEELIYNDFDIDRIKFFLHNLKNGDINDTKHRKASDSVYTRHMI